MTKRIRQFVKPRINYLCEQLPRKASPDGDIFIMTVPRSGLMWLTELMDTLPATRCVSEPLSPSKIPLMQNYFTPQRRYIDSSFHAPSNLTRYLGDILAHKILKLGCRSAYTAQFKPSTAVNVLTLSKVCNLTPYLQQLLGVRIVYLVRHPIANALSKMRNNWHESTAYGQSGWGQFIDVYLEDAVFVQEFLSPSMLNKAWDIRQHGTLLEKYVLSWCLDNVVPCRLMGSHPEWVLVSYEALVSDPKTTFENMLSRLHLDVPETASARFHKPSSSSAMSTQQTLQKIQTGDQQYLISRWREDVSGAEIDACFQILHDFDIHLYHPHHDVPNFQGWST